ncbi:MAG: universal stress protein [Thiohalorhabdus sp.]|uniref:universal stress protein n=1 Tax=Thiohalorhabdus sp. TaxID=3094134 RepID=UPI00397FE6F1
MADSEDSGEIRRILVLVDASRTSQAALEAAAELAARHDAELATLYVEDTDLLRLAGLPFAREVGTTSGVSRPLNLEQLERRLKGQAAEVRQRLRALAARHGVRWSLQVARGRAEAVALARAIPGDLLVVGKTGWSRLPYKRLGSTPRHLIRKADVDVSVMVYSPPASPRHHPIVAVFDDPDSGPRALALAAYIARTEADTLTILIPEEEAERLVPEVRRWLAGRGVDATLKLLRGREPEALTNVLHRERLQALVIHRSSPLIAGAVRQRLLEALDVPVVLVP